MISSGCLIDIAADHLYSIFFKYTFIKYIVSIVQCSRCLSYEPDTQSLDYHLVVYYTDMVFLFLVVLAQNPLVVYHVLVYITARLQLQSPLVVLVDLRKHQLRLRRPVVPATHHKHFFRPGNPLGFVAESVGFDFESGRALEHIFELLYNFPLRLPVVFSFVVKKFDFFSLTRLWFGVFGELFYFSFDFDPVDVDLILHSVELVVPSSCYIFLLHYTLKRIFSKFVVGGLVFEAL